LLTRSGGYLARPADQEWNTDTTFQGGEIRAAPWTGPTVPGLNKLCAIVACEDENGVVANAGIIHGVEHNGLQLLASSQVEAPRSASFAKGCGLLPFPWPCFARSPSGFDAEIELDGSN
jgi:hypothetical protein